mgnify:FL=1
MTDSKWENVVKYTIWGLIVLLTIILLSGCNPVKQAQKQFRLNPDKFAGLCGDYFPPKDSLIKGDTVTLTDTLWGAGETIIETKVVNDTIVKTKIEVREKVITKTVKVTDTVVRVNQAKVRELTDMINKCNATTTAQYAQISAQNKTISDYQKKIWRQRIAIWLIVAAFLVYLNRKRLFQILKNLSPVKF